MEMVCSALVQEAVSRGISFGLSRREEKASQGHILERLEMAVNELELALERSAKIPITEVPLLQRRKKIKDAYVEAMELLHKHKQQEVPASQEQISQGVKRKRWIVHDKNVPIASSAGLNTNHVGRFEWFAGSAGKFLRDLESGCSLRHYTFCSPMVRHILEGKTLRYLQEQENQLRCFFIWPTYSEERGVEAVLGYYFQDSTMTKKCFHILLVLRLSENIDIVGVAIKSLQFLTSQFKSAAESAIGELTQLPFQDMAHSYVPPLVGIEDWHNCMTSICRLDPACCKESRHGLCGNNSISSELPHRFHEQVIFSTFDCYIPAPEPRLRSRISSDKADRNVNRGWRSPLLATVAFMPHVSVSDDSYALELIGNAKERTDAGIQGMGTTIKSHAINCLLHDPELMEYQIHWYSKHGGAYFVVQEPRIERRRYSTRTGKYKGKYVH